jgi:hypothetical protein
MAEPAMAFFFEPAGLEINWPDMLRLINIIGAFPQTFRGGK